MPVKHLEMGAFFALKLGNVFRTVSENEFMEIAKDKKLVTEKKNEDSFLGISILFH